MVCVSDSSDHKMPAFFSRSFRRLERRKRKMLKVVDGWQPAWLTYAPGPEAWSVLQLFDHLIRTERSVRQSCERNLASEQGRISLRERIRAKPFLFLFSLPIRVHIPKAVLFLQPGAPKSLDELVAAWDEERHQLHDFLLLQNKRSLNSVAMRHPAIGALTLRNTLRFLAVHLWHHEYQALRLRWAIAQKFGRLKM